MFLNGQGITRRPDPRRVSERQTESGGRSNWRQGPDSVGLERRDLF